MQNRAFRPYCPAGDDPRPTEVPGRPGSGAVVGGGRRRPDGRILRQPEGPLPVHSLLK
jgi:hypothetical protein